MNETTLIEAVKGHFNEAWDLLPSSTECGLAYIITRCPIGQSYTIQKAEGDNANGGGEFLAYRAEGDWEYKGTLAEVAEAIKAPYAAAIQ